MIPRHLIFLLPFYLSVSALEKTYGVPPDLLAKYSPASDGKTWTCLDGSKSIPWDAVNDDFCDCADGSDEPGTGACSNTTFYCQNVGHIGESIPASRVKDGLCDCCDGSDELPGTCPNTCKEVGEEYRKKVEAERKIRKKGAKIRSSYITFAQKEKTRLEALIRSAEQDIQVREQEVERLKEIADRSESLSAAALEHKQNSPLYQNLLSHAGALRSLRREYENHLAREKQLADILDTLRAGYNPNYQDMAVLAAVRGWEAFAGLPSLNERDNSEEKEEEKKEAAEEEVEEEEELEEGDWTTEELEKDLDGLLETDYVSLLLAHDEHIQAPPPAVPLLTNISAYLPDALVPGYEAVKETVVGWLETFGIIPPASTGSRFTSGSSAARQAHTDAEASLSRARQTLNSAQDELGELFSGSKFGSQGEWKKLDGTCIEKDIGDYTYELCFFKEAKQKPKKGGQTFNLGKFNNWSSEHANTQLYTRGTRCWNGPDRSARVSIECGVENELLSVAELEKCEYGFVVKSPAMCLPLDGDGEKKAKKADGEREEL